MIAQELATRMGLCDGLGAPTGGFAGYVEVRGVVAGAAERLPKVFVTYRIKGKTMRVWAGVTRARPAGAVGLQRNGGDVQEARGRLPQKRGRGCGDCPAAEDAKSSPNQPS